jgi:hypothetical protein
MWQFLVLPMSDWLGGAGLIQPFMDMLRVLGRCD